MLHTDEAPTPRTSGTFRQHFDVASQLRRKLAIGAIAFAKRPDLGHDYGAARRCRELCADADLLTEIFEGWATKPPSDEDRQGDLFALARLIEESQDLIARLTLNH